MTDTIDLAAQLKIAAAMLFASAQEQRRTIDARMADLDLLVHDAEAREHRRAAFNRRDQACYRLGGAFEPGGGLDLDPVALTGFLELGSTALLLLLRQVLERPAASMVDHLARLFRSPEGRAIRAHGVWIRWNWLRTIYVAETETFLASRKGRDAKARWRSDKITVNQSYLVAQICLDLEVEPRTFPTRGEAFDWIRSAGGNPRFEREPPKPDLKRLADVLR